MDAALRLRRTLHRLPHTRPRARRILQDHLLIPQQGKADTYFFPSYHSCLLCLELSSVSSLLQPSIHSWKSCVQSDFSKLQVRPVKFTELNLRMVSCDLLCIGWCCSPSNGGYSPSAPGYSPSQNQQFTPTYSKDDSNNV